MGRQTPPWRAEYASVKWARSVAIASAPNWVYRREVMRGAP